MSSIQLTIDLPQDAFSILRTHLTALLKKCVGGNQMV
jgi:hypothetical protein